MDRLVRHCVLALALVPVLYATPNAAGAAGDYPRLRCLDVRAEGVLKDALKRSATVRRLAGDIQQSDVIVYLRVGRLHSGIGGSTQLVSVSRQNRFLMVTLEETGGPSEMLPRLGHELRHVLEIASAPEVTSADAMRQLFARIGWRSSGDNQYETREAVDAGWRVAREMWERPVASGVVARADRPRERSSQPQ